MSLLPVGVGVGWRPATALLVERNRAAFTEVIAESIGPRLPPPIELAIERGIPVIAHGVSLDLGNAHGIDRTRLARFVEVARRLRSPLVSEHVAFCRAGDRESPHFLPVPRTTAQLAILVDNVRRVQDALRVPLALENIAAPIEWPGAELAEADFLAALLDRTGALLLLDASNLHANLTNHGGDLDRYLDRLPLDRIAYVHVAGGATMPSGLYRDTHAHDVDEAGLATLARVLARTGPVPLLLERDAHFATTLADELATLAAVLARTPPRTIQATRTDSLRLPPLDDAARAAVAAHHATLFEALDAPDAPADDRFDARQLSELRSIIGVKRRSRR